MKTSIFKYSVSLALVIMLMLACICAFAEHAHTPLESWDRNATEHWKNCECGEFLERAPHEMGDIFCTICGSEIWLYDDGTADVFDYFEDGDLRRNTFYDIDGNVIGEYTYEYGYDDEGHLIWSKTYYGQLLAEETQYSVNTEGESIAAVQTGYSEEGTWSRNEYDASGSIISIRTYSAEGALMFEELYEYTYADDGLITQTKISGSFEDGSSYLWVDNQYGDRISGVMYEADGTVVMDYTTEIGYDDLGNKLWYKTYRSGVLTEEAVYALYTDEAGSWSYEQLYTEYLEEGGKIVTEYDYEGSEISRTEYDAQGNVVE